MVNSNNLKNIVLDAIAEFYQKYIKPETREMVEEIVDERTGPIRASQIEIERKLDVAIGDYQGQQLQLQNHEKKLQKLEHQQAISR